MSRIRIARALGFGNADDAACMGCHQAQDRGRSTPELHKADSLCRPAEVRFEGKRIVDRAWVQPTQRPARPFGRARRRHTPPKSHCDLPHSRDRARRIEKPTRCVPPQQQRAAAASPDELTPGCCRVRRERPDRYAAEQRDELTPPHSITSSARATRVGGTSRPNALAAFRLITSSYLVGACTGRSAGFSPLRIRSRQCRGRAADRRDHGNFSVDQIGCQCRQAQ
jgi:hypothetical protein